MSDSLSVFSDPRSVVVVGASADPAKWGYQLARGALAGSGRRDVHLVNRKAAVIAGVRSVPSLSEVGSPPDLVVLCTPASSVPEVVEQALELGARGFLGITSGIDAVHGPGAERQLATRIRSAGARLIGPNCLGLYDAAHQLDLAWGAFTPGSLGIVSQSGQLGLELAKLADHAGAGVSRFVSVGNQVDVSATDLLAQLAHSEATRAVVLYLESFTGGRDLVAVLGRLRDAGKPVAVLTVGATEASRAAARSHTGALTASADVVAAACRTAGAVLLDTPAQAVDLAALLAGHPRPRGRRVAVVSDSGGHGAIAVDTLARHGLTVPRLSDGTSARLASLLPPAAVGNPVDLAGAGEQDINTYAHLVDIVAGSGEVDTVVLSGYFGCYGADVPELVDRELAVVRALGTLANAHGRSVVVHSISRDSLAVRTLRELGVPSFDTIDAVARSLGIAAELYEHRHDQVPPAAAACVAEGAGAATPYLQGRDRLAAYGIDYPRAAAIRATEDLQAATTSLSAPYVLKAGWLEHKTEVGGVATGLVDAESARSTFEEMRARLGDGEYVLEEMDSRPDVVEMIVGGLRDPSFGPVVLVGLGGVQAELYRDVRVALAPLDERQAVSMIDSLAASPLLHGWRGRPAVDVEAAARVVAAVSCALAENDDIVECDVNPVRVGPGGALAVDAHVVTAVKADAPGPPMTGVAP